MAVRQSVTYAEECENLVGHIETVRTVRSILGVGIQDGPKETQLKKELDTLIQSIPEVWVVGAQGAGKSTLINRLIGFEIMPAGSRAQQTIGMITCRPTRFTTERKKGYTGAPRIDLKFLNVTAQEQHTRDLPELLKYSVEDSQIRPMNPQDLPLDEQLRLLHDPLAISRWAGVKYASNQPLLNALDISKLTIDIKLILPADYSSSTVTEPLQYVSFVDIPGLMLGQGDNLEFDATLKRLFRDIFEFAKRDANDERFKRSKCMIVTIPSTFDDSTDQQTGVCPGHRVFTKTDELDDEGRTAQRSNVHSALKRRGPNTHTFMVGHLNEENWESFQGPDARPEWTKAEESQVDFDRVQFGLHSLKEVVFRQLKDNVISFAQEIRNQSGEILNLLLLKEQLNYNMLPFLSQFYGRFSQAPGPLNPMGGVNERIRPEDRRFLSGAPFQPGKSGLWSFYLRFCRLLRVTIDATDPTLETTSSFDRLLNEVTADCIPILGDLRIHKMQKARDFVRDSCRALEQRHNNSTMILVDICDVFQTSNDELLVRDVSCVPYIDALFKHCANDVSRKTLQKDVLISSVCQSFWESQNTATSSLKIPESTPSAFRTPLTSLARSAISCISETLEKAFDAIGGSLGEHLPAYQHLCSCFKAVVWNALFEAEQSGYWNCLALTSTKLQPKGQIADWPAELWSTTCISVSPDLSYNDIERFLIQEFSTHPVLSQDDHDTQTEVEKCLESLNELQRKAEKQLDVLKRFASSELLKIAVTEIVKLQKESVQRNSSAWTKLFEAASVERPTAESEPIFFSKQIQARILHISVGNQDEVYWPKPDGGYSGHESHDQPRVLYLIRLICDGVLQANGQPTTVHNVYRSLPEVIKFYQESQMLKKYPDFGRHSVLSLMQDEAFKKASQYYRADFLTKASSVLSDFFLETARLVRQAQPDDKLLFIEELDRFLLDQHKERSKKICNESNECSLFGVSASFGEKDFLSGASKILLEQVIVCSVETQIRASGLRSDGHLRQALHPWRTHALELCKIKSSEDTQQIILAAASIERARIALNHPALKFFKHLCTPGHEIRQKFDSLCAEWNTNDGCPMMPSQKAQMAVACFLIEENAKTHFKLAVKEIKDQIHGFFDGLSKNILRKHDGKAGEGSWYDQILELIVLEKLPDFNLAQVPSSRSEVFERRQFDEYFRRVLDVHREKGLETCTLRNLIITFERMRAPSSN